MPNCEDNSYERTYRDIFIHGLANNTNKIRNKIARAECGVRRRCKHDLESVKHGERLSRRRRRAAGQVVALRKAAQWLA
ncbi:hypothetical protein EVAR_95410_1 [Eumeta japonica]|uniref:Uncharacterized protein n=1 Tax=Eumeta variegata TaxID=151549 RepID=A0A4C1VIU3_EUMVA|nr:hypothetical protein EVAR_95410_1 [Eumeta japonica]